MKNITTVSVDKDFSKEMKIFCALHGLNMKELVEVAVKAYMEAHDE